MKPPGDADRRAARSLTPRSAPGAAPRRPALLALAISLVACGARGALDDATSTTTTGTTGAGAGGAGGAPASSSSSTGGAGAVSASAASSSSGAGAGNCGPIFAGKYDFASSRWENLPGAAGATSLAAGDNQCQALGLGALHVCDYTEVRLAEAHGELLGVPAGTTAWVQRTTTELVNGLPSAPGPGGNCHNWTYAGNHLGDGEYLSFDQPGLPTYFLDDDTGWNPGGPDQNDHAQPGLLQCGGTMRSIFCCYPPCVPPGG
jgi:hypothetical protein